MPIKLALSLDWHNLLWNMNVVHLPAICKFPAEWMWNQHCRQHSSYQKSCNNKVNFHVSECVFSVFRHDMLSHNWPVYYFLLIFPNGRRRVTASTWFLDRRTLSSNLKVNYDNTEVGEIYWRSWQHKVLYNSIVLGYYWQTSRLWKR